MPAIVEENPGIGFDYYNTPSCIPLKKYFDADNEIVMHMQVGIALTACLYIYQEALPCSKVASQHEFHTLHTSPALMLHV